MSTTARSKPRPRRRVRRAAREQVGDQLQHVAVGQAPQRGGAVRVQHGQRVMLGIRGDLAVERHVVGAAHDALGLPDERSRVRVLQVDRADELGVR